MALWMVRAGGSGAYETKFLDEGRIYLTWEALHDNLSTLPDRPALLDVLRSRYPDSKPGQLKNWAGQIWAFSKAIDVGDCVVLPSKKKPAIHVGKVTGGYQNVPEGPSPYYHYRTVDWFATDIPRQNFSQDILYSFGAFMTICRIKRNDAEARVKAMAANNWKSTTSSVVSPSVAHEDADEDEEGVDYPLFEDTPRYDVSATLAVTSMQFGASVRVLCAEGLLLGAATVLRSQFEALVRSVWALYRATDGQIGKLSVELSVEAQQAGKNLPSVNDMMVELEKFSQLANLLVALKEFKESS